MTTRDEDSFFFAMSPSSCQLNGTTPPPIVGSPQHLQENKFHPVVDEAKTDLFIPTLSDEKDHCGFLGDEEMNISLSPRHTSEEGFEVSLVPRNQYHREHLFMFDQGSSSSSSMPSATLDNDTFSISDDESMGDFPEFPELDDCVSTCSDDDCVDRDARIGDSFYGQRDRL
ncbi:hypothetical protein ACA910_000780 [Epithemia clementina (nom. ined.)]